MKNVTILLVLFFSHSSFGQTYYPPSIQWQKCIGGSSGDGAWDINKTIDGGYILIGTTQSTDGDAVGNTYTPTALWVLKLDALGSIEWKRFFSLYSNTYENFSIETTPDSGYIFGGDSVTKLANNGALQWQYPYPAYQVRPTFDGGYAVSNGFAHSVLKLTGTGLYEWSSDCLVTGNLNALMQLPDSNYLVAIYYYDMGPASEVSTVLDTNSNCLFVYGDMGHGSFRTNAMCNTYDNGFALSGTYGIRKYNNNNNNLWAKSIGAHEGVVQFSDSSLIVAGGETDAMFTKLSAQGDILWTKMVGGSTNEGFKKVIETSDGGYIAVGTTMSNDGDVSGNHGGKDIWLVKFGPDSISTTAINTAVQKWEINIYPNPANGTFTISVPEDGLAEIYDIQGRLAYSFHIPKGESPVIVPGHISAGTYLLKYKGNTISTNKILLYQP